MSRNPWTAIVIGSTVGGLIPQIWGAGMLSLSTMLFSAIGAIVAIWVAYQVS